MCPTGKKSYDKKTALVVKNERRLGTPDIGFVRGRLKIKKRNKRNAQELRIYQCKKCNMWHLTHHKYRPTIHD